MEQDRLESVLESVLFAAGEPVPGARLCEGLDITPEELARGAEALADRLQREGRGVRVVRLENAYQMCSAPEYAHLVRGILERRKPPRLSQAALEVLAILAYHQPVTRAYVDQVRGVDSAYTVGLLVERGLIEERGRLAVPGRPILYGTTADFLRAFGLASLEELPPLPEKGNGTPESLAAGLVAPEVEA